MFRLLLITLTLLMICGVVSANMKVTMLDVGQGDAVLIQTPSQNVLIDTSDVDERAKLRQQLYRIGAFRIDKILLTHPHVDHIGNAGFLVANGVFKIKAVYDNGIISSSKYYQQYVKECQARNVPLIGLKAGDVIDLGDGAKFEILYPPIELVNLRNTYPLKGDPNNESLIGRLTYGNFSMLFTGDAESIVEEDILPQLEECTILKIGHHGSYTSTSAKFLQKVNPKYAFISAGVPTTKKGGNTYGHPHAQVLRTILAAIPKENIYWTAVNGNVTVETDGDSWQVYSDRAIEWLDFYLLTRQTP